MKTTAIDSTFTNLDTPYSLLPAELFFGICSLCQTTSSLPATFRTAALQLFKPGAQPYRIWTHRIVFCDPQYDPEAVNNSHGHTPAKRHHIVNTWYPAAYQIESHLAFFLKAQLPSEEGLAAGVAPPVTNRGSRWPVHGLVVTRALIDWLFSSQGPFGQQRQLSSRLDWDWVAELTAIRGRVGITGGLDEEDDWGNWGDWGAPTNQLSTSHTSPGSTAAQVLAVDRPSIPNWRLLPDGFLLAAFFIRTSQLDLLDSTLVHLRSTLLPTLATARAPFSLWCHYMLHDHVDLRTCLSDVVYSNGDPLMTYPSFLCFLSLVDWSLPALQVITRVFADTMDLRATAALITSSFHMSEAILGILRQLTSPESESARVLDVLDWLRQHDAIFNMQLFPFICHWIPNSYPIFADVFTTHDLVNLPLVDEAPARHELGAMIVDWVCRGHPDLLSVAVDKNLLGEEEKGRVLRRAALTEDKALAAIVLDKFTDGDGVLISMIINALRVDHAPAETPSYPFLFNALVTYGSKSMDPNQVLVNESQHWPHAVLSAILFDQPQSEYLFRWDFARHLIQHLTWAKSMHYFQDDWANFMGQLIDRCSNNGFDWRALGVDQVATACAVRFIALMHKYGPDHAPEESEVSHDVIEVTRVLVNATLDKIKLDQPTTGIGHGAAKQEPLPKTFSSLIPRGCCFMLGSLVDAVTSFIRSKPLTQDEVSCPTAAHNVFLDSLLRLDRAFVISHIRFQCPETVWVWPRFEFSEMVKRTTPDRAVGFVRAAVGARDESAVARIIGNVPSSTMSSERFLVGLGAIMNRKASWKATIVFGLDQSNWMDWREQLARYLPLPAGGDDGEDAEEDECEKYFLFE